mmetsp:Transcript_11732/g.26180  ORF Transcript_11732/g.26180 Transcript_11732/m.26180 type:complete len:215 (+) Transcript_11732:176-820(+)
MCSRPSFLVPETGVPLEVFRSPRAAAGCGRVARFLLAAHDPPTILAPWIRPHAVEAIFLFLGKRRLDVPLVNWCTSAGQPGIALVVWNVEGGEDARNAYSLAVDGASVGGVHVDEVAHECRQGSEEDAGEDSAHASLLLLKFVRLLCGRGLLLLGLYLFCSVPCHGFRHVSHRKERSLVELPQYSTKPHVHNASLFDLLGRSRADCPRGGSQKI